MSARRFVVALALIAAAAFAGRVVYVLAVTRYETGFYDRVYYTGAAERLGAGDGFKTPPIFGDPDREDALHPPLTAVTLSPITRLTDGDVPLRIAVALAGVGVVTLIGLVGREVAGARAGLLAAAIAAVYPNLWANDGLIMAETFAALGTAAALFCAYRLLRAPTWPNAAGTGVACAVAMLSRSELALLVPLTAIPAALMIRGMARRARLRLAGIVVLTAGLTVAPWVVHNLTRFEKPVLLSHGDGGALLGANCDETYAGEELGFWNGLCGVPRSRDGTTIRGEDASVEEAWRREQALEYMGDHLGRLPIVIAARVGRLWNVYRVPHMVEIGETEGRPEWVSITGLALYWTLAALAAVGALTLRRRGVPLLPVAGPIFIATLVAAAFYGLVRFRAPAEVSIVVLAAVAVDVLVTRFAHYRRPDVSEVSGVTDGRS